MNMNGSLNATVEADNARGGEKSGSLVVRVKRRRDSQSSQAPQQICVVEAASRSTGLSSLSINDSTSSSKKKRVHSRIILNLVSTIDSSSSRSVPSGEDENGLTTAATSSSSSEGSLDMNTLSAIKKKRIRIEEGGVDRELGAPSSSCGKAKASEFMYMTEGKKTLKDSSGGGDSLLVVDMSCKELSKVERVRNGVWGGAEVPTRSGRLGIKVTTPVTRQVLEPAMLAATQSGGLTHPHHHTFQFTNSFHSFPRVFFFLSASAFSPLLSTDFTGVLEAIAQGADVNHQIKSTGLSPLMVAVMANDPRVVSKVVLYVISIGLFISLI